MKQNMKRLMLVLCIITCFFSLSACQNAAVSDKTAVDEQTSENISAFASGLFEQMALMTAPNLEEQITLAQQNKDFVFAEGLQSWLNVKSDVGDFEYIISSEVTAEDNGFSCVVRASFSNREMEYKIYLDDEGILTSMSFAPEYTVGEKMTKALMNTLMGMGTVFLVLIFICVLISGFKLINNFEKKLKNREASAAVTTDQVPAAVPEPVPAEPVSEIITDNLELMAVIMAAIVAAEGSAAADGLVVRSIRRVPDTKWKNA